MLKIFRAVAALVGSLTVGATVGAVAAPVEYTTISFLLLSATKIITKYRKGIKNKIGLDIHSVLALEEAERILFKVLDKTPFQKKALMLIQDINYENIQFLIEDYEYYREQGYRVNWNELDPKLLESYIKFVDTALLLMREHPDTTEEQENYLLDKIFIGADILFLDPYSFFLLIRESNHICSEDQMMFYGLLSSDKWRKTFAKSTKISEVLSGFENRLNDSDQKQKPSSIQESCSENYFYRKGEVWEISYKGSERFILQDRKGIKIIAYLLANPKRDFKAEALRREVGEQITETVNYEDLYDENLQVSESIVSKNYEQEVRDENKEIIKLSDKMIPLLEKEIEEARIKNNPEHLLQAKQELEKFERTRKAFSDDKSVQKTIAKAVAKNIKDTLKSIKAKNRPLYLHLNNSINRGYSCKYNPSEDIEWDVK